MKKRNKQNRPSGKIIPLSGANSQLVRKLSNTIPEELKQLDGSALAAVKPDDNVVGGQFKIVRDETRTANSVEFMLHPDGTLMKFVARPNAGAQQLLIDGDSPSKVFGIACNAEVADLICNGVNALHLATVMQRAEDAKRESEKQLAENPSGAPPPILLPPVNPGGIR
jgi:hypothetical protein